MRDYRFDVARVVCMTIIVVYVHLYAYIHPEVKSAYFIPAWAIITDACLGLFTFVSGFLLGKKYCFGPDGNSKVGEFYRKRILRIIPLFVIASIALWAIGFNGTRATFNGLVCISPFIKPRPQTLWYIPVILFCYIITPLISRRQLKWRVWSCLFVFCLLILLSKLLPSVDNRLGYNSFFVTTQHPCHE